MRTPRTPRLVGLTAATLALVASSVALAPQATAGVAPVRHVAAHGSFADPLTTTPAGAFTYDVALVPPGASARVDAWYLPNGRTVVVLLVRGLLPDREYGAHAHSAACGATGALAGPHFQDVPDPVVPSVDPAYANSDNEIWLDFTTDHKGRGWAIAVQSWQPTADRRPASVVIHLEHTHDGSGTPPAPPAGTAGARLACLTVGF